MRLDRIETQETVLIDIADCPERPELDDTCMSAITVDVSKEGLKMGSNLEIPVGSFLGMRVSIRGRLFRLEGEVRWHIREDGAWFSGVQLRDSSPDFVEWREMFLVDVEWQAPLRVQAI
ncbi:MAG: PilZ domain-containing protein [Pseudomonadota bacterium]